MEKGTNYATSYILRNVVGDKISELELYVQSVLNGSCVTFSDASEIKESFSPFVTEYSQKLNFDERQALLHYTGLGSRSINSILRGYWDYEYSGKLTDETKKQAEVEAETLRKALFKVNELPFSMKTYRGVSLSYFYPYNIHSLEELTLLEGKYIYDEGYLSTSMLRETSFFSRQPGFGNPCNIEIEYLIPKSSEDGVPLLDPNFSGSVSLNEYLINCSSFFRVYEVKVDKTKNTAHMKMALIPQKVWNYRDYEMERSQLSFK